MKKIILSGIALGVLLGSSAMAEDFQGSIKLGFFDSKSAGMNKVKISMIQAIEVAKKSVNGKVVKAKFDKEDGYLVYEIKIINTKGQEMEVYVDPVTAKVLESKKDD